MFCLKLTRFVTVTQQHKQTTGELIPLMNIDFQHAEVVQLIPVRTTLAEMEEPVLFLAPATDVLATLAGKDTNVKIGLLLLSMLAAITHAEMVAVA